MPFNLLLFPLLAGYIFLHNHRYLKLKAQTLDGYRLLLETSKWGLLFLFGSALGAILLSRFAWTARATSAIHVYIPFDYFGTAIGALLLGICAGPFLNIWQDPLKAKGKALERQGHVLLQLLNRAVRDSHLVSVTLDTRKWYVGFVVETPNLDPKEQYLALIPVFSGYRDKDTLEAIRLTAYKFEEDVDPEFYAKVIPLDRVIDANLFDEALFEQHYESSSKSANGQK